MTGHPKHPWEILPMLVEADILSREEAKHIILAHEDANRRALQEIHALIPELMARELIDPHGAEKVRAVVIKAMRDGMPDL